MESNPNEIAIACPLCGCSEFGVYRGRPLATCAGCGAKERSRFLGLVLQQLLPQPSGAPVYHFAPERKIAEILHRHFGPTYVPADIDPGTYSWSKVPVRKVDLCRPAAHIEMPVQGLVHSHVLEHIPAPIERVVHDMNRLIEPGGFHVFQVPIHAGWYREDMDPDLNVAERERLFFQHDHIRLFGRQDFRERLLDLFQGFEQVDIAKYVTVENLVRGAIPGSALSSLTGHSVFFFRKRS
jgi:hypothetical protein